ncbi:hypothetical protein HBN50_04725 [Halobacteriovorax sp. GB3]|uniref:hypothetical protein n=1 Tax=Halobacteriovorax sp. GB3 TaxID=2719615 RepID=UPI0023623F77|nr:hypothetical protein [Halobacteriovorax sp. GB3]MDD0852388.1 hypothetical protein [Halobacteriovorax sp. GB3]
MRNILLPLITLFTSCMANQAQFEQQVAKEASKLDKNVRADVKELTNNYKGLPSSDQILSKIDETLSPPTKTCHVNPDSESQPDLDQYPEQCQIDGQSEQWLDNCRELFTMKDIPKDALKYALNVMKKNSTEFKSNKCYRFGGGTNRHSRSFKGEKHKDWLNKMQNGLPNKCTFIINDLDNLKKTHGGIFKCQANSHYIDLCGKKPIHKIETANLGYGTCKKKNGYKNKPGLGTTLVGAFFTGSKVFNYAATNPAKDRKHYGPIRKKNPKGIAHGIALFGLNKSNDRSATDAKHMHVSPYQSSAGCPSIDKDNWPMIDDLAKKGPSLVLNYKKSLIEDINECSE